MTMPIITITKPSTKLIKEAIGLQLASAVLLINEASYNTAVESKDGLCPFQWALQTALELLDNANAILEKHCIYLSENKQLFFKAHIKNLNNHVSTMQKN